MPGLLEVSLTEVVPRPGVELVRRALGAGVDAGRVAIEAGHRAVAGGVSDYVERIRPAEASEGTRELVDQVVRAHVMLARGEGAAAGVATSTAEATTIVGSAGTLTLPSLVVITAMDLTGLLWIQLRMVLTIAALHGHDPTHPDRIREFLALQGAMPATATPIVAAPLSAAAGRVTTRLVTRHLRGPALASVTALFRVVGIRFSRAALLRQVFLVNIPVNVLVNSAATRRLGQKARRFYETLPAAARQPSAE